MAEKKKSSAKPKEKPKAAPRKKEQKYKCRSCGLEFTKGQLDKHHAHQCKECRQGFVEAVVEEEDEK